MATYEIKLGGELRPIDFCFNSIRKFCDEYKLKLADIDKLNAETISPTQALSLIYWGLHEGHRKSGKPFTADLDTIGDWVNEDGAVLADAFAVFAQSQAPPPDESKKE